MDSERDVVMVYLKHIAESRLKRHTPGLYISLNMFSYARNGLYISDLLVKKPEKFFEVLKSYFGSEEMAKRIVRHVLKPLAEAGQDGEEAINKLIRGDAEGFFEIAERLLKDEAKRWAGR